MPSGHTQGQFYFYIILLTPWLFQTHFNIHEFRNWCALLFRVYAHPCTLALYTIKYVNLSSSAVVHAVHLLFIIVLLFTLLLLLLLPPLLQRLDLPLMHTHARACARTHTHTHTHTKVTPFHFMPYKNRKPTHSWGTQDTLFLYTDKWTQTYHYVSVSSQRRWWHWKISCNTWKHKQLTGDILSWNLKPKFLISYFVGVLQAFQTRTFPWHQRLSPALIAQVPLSVNNVRLMKIGKTKLTSNPPSPVTNTHDKVQNVDHNSWTLLILSCEKRKLSFVFVINCISCFHDPKLWNVSLVSI
jgi:hypothetical protein